MLLAADLGTSNVKVCLFGEAGLLAIGRAPLTSAHPAPGRVEQDAGSWWDAFAAATAAARAAARPADWRQVAALSFSTARETIVPVDPSGAPLGPAIVWSDRRAVAEAAELAARLGGAEAVRRRTGVPIDGASVAAKLAWLDRHHPDLAGRCRWIVGPRDLLVLHLTGEVATDTTVATRSGLLGRDLAPLDELAGPWRDRLPPVLAPATVAGHLRDAPAALLGLPAGLPVVVGAGDRACEALGAGASTGVPAVSWGTAASCSMPVADRPDPPPPGMAVTAAADGGWLVEAGQSGAGAALGWLGRLSGRTTEALVGLAADSPPGARGVLALPWFDGARSPWWRSDVGGAFAGLDSAQGLGDLVRAVVEAVALDVARALQLVGPTTELVACGGGASSAWVEILAAATAMPVRRRASGESGSVGAAALAAAVAGLAFDLERVNPTVDRQLPDPRLVACYAALRPVADRLAAAILELHAPTA